MWAFYFLASRHVLQENTIHRRMGDSRKLAIVKTSHNDHRLEVHRDQFCCPPEGRSFDPVPIQERDDVSAPNPVQGIELAFIGAQCGITSQELDYPAMFKGLCQYLGIALRDAPLRCPSGGPNGEPVSMLKDVVTHSCIPGQNLG